MAQLHELVNPQLLKVGAGVLVIAYAIKVFVNYRNALASLNHTPGFRGFLSHRSHLARLAPNWKYFNSGEIFEYWNKYEGTSLIHGDLEYLLITSNRIGFEKAGLDIISVVNLWPNNAPTLLLADPDAIKVILFSHSPHSCP